VQTQLTRIEAYVPEVCAKWSNGELCEALKSLRWQIHIYDKTLMQRKQQATTNTNTNQHGAIY